MSVTASENAADAAAYKRTCMCAQVDESHIGQKITIAGWVNKKRELGSLTFITVRDRTGLVQVVIDEQNVTEETAKLAASVRSEFVVAVTGIVKARSQENINPDMQTGGIEISACSFCVITEADVPPFSVADSGVKDDLRLKYRYIDLRRPELTQAIMTRHKITGTIREFLNEQGFLDIETPILTKSTPEGARDYLVPSRVHNGCFYALPQSPQLMKQLLMVSGFDKYYQIVRCFRDEDLRADRQPEFTQVDMEMSFVDTQDVMDVLEKLFARLMKEILGINVTLPFDRLSYKEAMERYGSDKPDTRFGMELCDISELKCVKSTEFQVFRSALEIGGSVRAISASGLAAYSRRQLDALTETAKTYGAKGLVWIAACDDGTYKSSVSKFFDDDALGEITRAVGAAKGDLVLICADENEKVFSALGALRLSLAESMGVMDKNAFNFLWITEFPLFEYDKEEKRLYALHHPFTSPFEEDIPLFESNPERMRAKAYDLVLNGTELGSGSIRIHRRNIQQMMFAAIGLGEAEAKEQFGFLLEAFRFGAPPHGGFAFGLDRLCMLLMKKDSIRDCIAFPKTKDASCPLTGAPSVVSDAQLTELGIAEREC